MGSLHTAVFLALILATGITGLLALPGVIAAYVPWGPGKAVRGPKARKLGAAMLALAILSGLQVNYLIFWIARVGSLVPDSILVAMHIGCWIYVSRNASASAS